MHVSMAVICCLLASGQDFIVRVDQPVPDFRIGREFEQSLDQGMAASWSNVTLRSALRRLGAERKIAILRDRRLDPEQLLSFSSSEKPTRELIPELAQAAGARASFADNTIFLGPHSAVQNLRTLIALRRQDLLEAQPPIRRSWRTRLGRPQTIHWNDLDRPVDIVRGIAKHYQLRVFGLQRIPHDLWAGATIPAADAATALSLILIQFDLTYEWQDDATIIELLPIPKMVALTRSYSPRPKTAAEAIQALKATIPSLDARAERGKVVVVGTLEQHEAIEALKRPRRPTRPGGSTTLDSQRLTLRIMGIPANKLMADLEKRYQLKFSYNAQQLKKADIDLSKKIDIDVKAVTIDAYLEAIFSQLGAKVQREGERVVIGVR